ncbi:MAG: PQQ-binding-like beta-propeller repeat protein [Blastopirellula sp. JB062]
MSRLISLPLVLLFFSVAGAGDNWPEFRGPQGDGVAESEKLPVQFNDPAQIRWKQAIHGRGWSSPVVWRDRIWVTTATEDGKRQSVLALDRHTGEILIDRVVFETEDPQEIEVSNSYASSTPAIEEGRIYVHYGSLGTACLDTATGATIWERRDLPCNHWRGAGSSPIIDQKNLYVAFDGYDYQYAAALDKRTGATVWRRDRNIDYGTDNGDRKKAYSTACLFTHQGERQLVMPSATETICYAPETGDELWRVRHGGMNAAPRPLYKHGLVYITGGDRDRKLFALDPTKRGQMPDEAIVWGMSKGAPFRPSQIILGERMYVISDKGIATCVNAKNGDTIWQQRIGGNYRASLLAAGGNLYCFDESGKITVFKASDQFELVAESILPDGFQASPAVAGDSLYLRTTQDLYCFERE